jgi:RNA 2',3'-cyclic 3'-phosphodiesterase
MRVFIAIRLSEEIAAALHRVQQTLLSRPEAKAARWVEPHNIHLTLKFLGDVDTGRLSQIYDALDHGCAGHVALHLTLANLGCFPSFSRPRVVWVGIGVNRPLLSLQQTIEKSLAPLGFAPENRPFQPHLTLARIRRDATASAGHELGEIVAALKEQVIGDQRVEGVEVIQSDLRPAGPIYRTLHKTELTPD